MSLKIKELPFGVIWQLCMYLDRVDQPQHNWKALLANAPGSPYTALQVSAFERVGLRPNGSSAETVIQDFITRGFTVDDLFTILKTMGHLEGMKILWNHVSPNLREEMEDGNEGRSSETGEGLGGGAGRGDERGGREQEPPRGQSPTAPKSSPPLEIHPQWGPLPPDPFISRGPFLDPQPKPGERSSPTSRKNGSPSSRPTIYQSSTVVVDNQSNGGVRVWEGGAQYGITTTKGMNYGPEGTYPRAVSQSPVSPGMYHVHPHSGQSQATTSPPRSQQATPTIPGMAPRQQQATPTIPGVAPRLQQATPTIPGVALPPSLLNQMPPTARPAPNGYEPHRMPTSQLPLHARVQGVPAQNPALPQPRPSDVVAPPTSPVLNILTFTYEELSEASGHFTQSIIGIGSFGTVFKAKIRGSGPYAIKKLHSESEMEGGVFHETCFHQETFQQELQMLTKYHHKNILSLVAYSNDGPRPCLVYEYMENGSLQDCLLGKQSISLPWSLRLEIANQIADALHFLHTVNRTKHLVHGDVKSANILLDSHYVPKLSDFGLARECQAKPGTRSTFSTGSSIVMGTLAYMAPEFLRNKKLTPSTDVYSFGVVLLELYTGQAADNPSLRQRTLTERLMYLLEDTDEGTPEHDQQVSDVLTHADPRALWPRDTGFDLFEIATVCLRPRAKARPPMEQVRTQLAHLSTESEMGRMRLSEPAAVHQFHGQSAGEAPPIPSPYMLNSDWT